MAITKGFLGIVMLDTQFPRPLGDIGNASTFDVPTHGEILRNAWPNTVVLSAGSLRQAGIVPAFQGVVRKLDRLGARAITTSCGFLVLLQKDLQMVTKLPVVTSSLMLLPKLLQTQRRVGVLTISAGHLGKEYLRCAGVPKDRLADVVVQGVAPGTEFVTRILGNQAQMDLAQAERDVVAAAVALKARAPDVQTVVLECTNMPPYIAAIEAATGFKTLWLKDVARLFDWAKPQTLSTEPEPSVGLAVAPTMVPTTATVISVATHTIQPLPAPTTSSV
jgi:Asp/Glu/Hydantoin racemase